MKSWLAKFRTSLALDSSVPRREKLPRAQDRRHAITRGEESLRALDQRLKATRPTTPVPAALHAAVMRAVRAGAASQKERLSAKRGWRWQTAPALVLLVIFGLGWLWSRPTNESPSLTAAASALEQGHEMAQKAPDAVLAPLSQEMENLNRDFQNAVEFLMASVP